MPRTHALIPKIPIDLIHPIQPTDHQPLPDKAPERSAKTDPDPAHCDAVTNGPSRRSASHRVHHRPGVSTSRYPRLSKRMSAAPASRSAAHRFTNLGEHFAGVAAQPRPPHLQPPSPTWPVFTNRSTYRCRYRSSVSSSPWILIRQRKHRLREKRNRRQPIAPAARSSQHAPSAHRSVCREQMPPHADVVAQVEQFIQRKAFSPMHRPCGRRSERCPPCCSCANPALPCTRIAMMRPAMLTWIGSVSSSSAVSPS